MHRIRCRRERRLSEAIKRLRGAAHTAFGTVQIRIAPSQLECTYVSIF